MGITNAVLELLGLSKTIRSLEDKRDNLSSMISDKVDERLSIKLVGVSQSESEILKKKAARLKTELYDEYSAQINADLIKLNRLKNGS